MTDTDSPPGKWISMLHFLIVLLLTAAILLVLLQGTPLWKAILGSVFSLTPAAQATPFEVASDSSPLVGGLRSDHPAYETAYVSLTLLSTLRRDMIRSWFPDGWVDVWLRIRAIVRAGILLDSLSTGDLRVTPQSDGSLSAVLKLPAPVITHREIEGEPEWGSSSSFWVWGNDRIAVELRSQLRRIAWSALDSIARSAGLFQEVCTHAAASAARILSAFGITSTEVILDTGEVLEFGTEAGAPDG